MKTHFSKFTTLKQFVSRKINFEFTDKSVAIQEGIDVPKGTVLSNDQIKDILKCLPSLKAYEDINNRLAKSSISFFQVIAHVPPIHEVNKKEVDRILRGE